MTTDVEQVEVEERIRKEIALERLVQAVAGTLALVVVRAVRRWKNQRDVGS